MKLRAARPGVPAWRAHAAALAAYLALAVGLTWPLALRLGSVVPHDLGDPVGFTWIIWWNSQALPLTAAWLNAPVFSPSAGAIVFQDSLLGVWPLTVALQWLGASPLATHNVLLIASFALSAFSAHLLAFRLFGDRGAAFAGGLAYGFALYRVAQLSHLNILLSFWVPLVLFGLHEYLATRRLRWLALAAACWALQGLTSGYFLAYSSVLVGLWAVFFLRARLRDHARLAAAFGLALACIWPWLSLYRTVHAAYGFRRSVGDADFYGADVAGLLKAPHVLAFWGRWLGDQTREEQCFPGLVLLIVCSLAIATSRYWVRPVLSAASRVFAGVALLFVGVATVAATAPTKFTVLGITVSLGGPFKPLTWVWVCLLCATMLSPPVRRVWRDRSVPGFYALAALALWILSLGPTVRFMGHRIWYKAPYAWLFLVPGFESVRVPARLWLLAVLALAVVAAHGLAKLRARAPRAAPALTTLVCVGFVLEAWPWNLPLPGPPERIAELEARPLRTPVLELPLDTFERDLAAMYRSMYHHAPVVNGYSGYAPASFVNLRVGLANGDPGVLAPFAERMPIDVVLHEGATDSAAQAAVVEAAGGRPVITTDRFRIYHLPRRPPLVEVTASPPASIARVVDADRGDVTRQLTDDDPLSFVESRELDVTLVRPCRADEVELAALPGLLAVTVLGGAGEQRETLRSGRVGELSVRGAFADPRSPRLRLRFPPADVSRLRIALHVQPPDRRATLLGVKVRGPGCG